MKLIKFLYELMLILVASAATAFALAVFAEWWAK